MHLIFDFLIFFYLLGAGMFFYFCIRAFFIVKDAKYLKYKKSALAFCGLLLIGWLIIFYGSFIEPRLIEINNIKISLRDDPDAREIKIAFITDPQFGPYKNEKFAERISQEIMEINPDLVLLGGDYIYRNAEDGKDLTGLKQAAEKFPIYAIMGNHEYNIGDPHKEDYLLYQYEDKTAATIQAFNELGIKLLENESELIEIRGRKFNLIGIDDMWAQRDNINRAWENVDVQYPKIILAHEPDFIKTSSLPEFKVDLQLSGHTHGGQITLPIIGPFAYIPIQLPKKYMYGLHAFRQSQIFISKGVGESGPRARLLCRPEIAVIHIKL